MTNDCLLAIGRKSTVESSEKRDPAVPVKHTGCKHRGSWPAGAGHSGRDDNVRKRVTRDTDLKIGHCRKTFDTSGLRLVNALPEKWNRDRQWG
jgi:hypothetical protein